MRDVAPDFAKHGQVIGNDRNAHAERLDQGQSITFGEAGEEQGARRTEVSAQVFVRAFVELDDVAAELLASVEDIENGLGFPTALADDQ